MKFQVIFSDNHCKNPMSRLLAHTNIMKDKIYRYTISI